MTTTTLNQEQHLAATTLTGPVVIIAGAGSGKTKTLIERIDNLVASGVNPANILAITFTNKAANELRERISLTAKSVHASTIHSLCVTILRQYLKGDFGEPKAFTIMDADDKNALMTQIFDDICDDLNRKGIPLFAENQKANKRKYLSTFSRNISTAKNENITADQYLNVTITKSHTMRDLTALMYKAYELATQRLMAYDFDDLLMETYKLLSSNNTILNAVQNKYQYLMVDEYQDTNVLQNSLVNIIASKYQNICVVGDPDQSIYGWRGAKIKNILRFEKAYPEAKIIYLNQNYRSSQNILDAANDVIQNNNKDDFGRKNLKSALNDVAPINKLRFNTAEDEAEYLVKEIKAQHEKGIAYKDIAVLYRTHALNRAFEHALQLENVPYKISGGLSFYDRAEIKDIIAYLNVLANYAYDPALRRIINTPSRGIGLKTLNILNAWSQSQPIPQPLLGAVLAVDSIMEIPQAKRETLNAFSAVYKNALKNNRTIVDLVTYLIVSFDYKNYLIQDDTTGERINNLNEFLSDARRFDIANPPMTDDALRLVANGQPLTMMRNQETLSRLTEFLATVATDRDISLKNSSDLKDDAGVTLMTVHSAKGLEFKSVFMIGLDDGVFPSGQSIRGLSMSAQSIDEERRLMYVAITRAKQYLTMSSAKYRFLYGDVRASTESRFLYEIKPERLNSVTIKPLHPQEHKVQSNPWAR